MKCPPLGKWWGWGGAPGHGALRGMGKTGLGPKEMDAETLTQSQTFSRRITVWTLVPQL